MGQRSQTFVKVFNPVFEARKRFSEKPTDPEMLKRYNTRAKALKKWEKVFGTGEYTVLAYHHQWLYGLTFPALIHQLLRFYRHKTVNEYSNHPVHMDFFMSDMGIGFNKIDAVMTRFIEFHTMLLGIYQHPWSGTRGVGLEGFRFLNIDEPEMREYFDRGDNNDGICIVDAIEGKYVFMSVHDEQGYNDWGVYNLKPYSPVSAGEYVTAYYPTDPLRIDPPSEGEPTVEEKIKDHTQRVKRATAAFKAYPVLTVDEVIALFPKSEKEMRKWQNKP